MKYNEMIKFLNNNGICAIQPVIASEVSAQLEKDIADEEFEVVCNKIYETYLNCIDNVDMWDMVNEELIARGYKDNF